MVKKNLLPQEYVIEGVKKLFSLTNIKIDLAKKAHTNHVKPRPLPLAEMLSGRKIESIIEAEEEVTRLKEEIDYEDQGKIASTTLELMEIIEGVKHKFEPPELCLLLDKGELQKIEQTAIDQSVNILLMSDEIQQGINLYIGYDPPGNKTDGAAKGKIGDKIIHFARVPSALAFYLTHAFRSNILSSEGKLCNTKVILGHKTLILDAVFSALNYYGAQPLILEDKIE